MVKRAVNANEAPTHPNVLRFGVASPDRPRLAAGYMDQPTPRRRLRRSDVEWVRERLNDRDLRIVQEINRVRIASGEQLERLCFAGVTAGRSRTATRSRALGRLARWRVLVAVGRRIGGRERGSTAQVYALDTVGQRLLAGDNLAAGEAVRVRRPGPPGVWSRQHLLAVAELYTQLVEQARTTGLELVTFKAEPGAHWPDGRGGRLKPDAYAVLGRPGARDHWWLEVDLATESLPTLRAKLQTYLDFQRRGERGPGDVTPWVLVATNTERRRDAIRGMVRRMPEAAGLVTVVTSSEAADRMFAVLRE